MDADQAFGGLHQLLADGLPRDFPPLRNTVAMLGNAMTVVIAEDSILLREGVVRLLSEAGFAVVCGGGPGLMEATNKGAFSGGGMAVGLNIDLPGEQPASRYQHISLRFKHFFTRKAMFAKVATAFVVLPGGYGTLDELFEALTLVQTGKTRQMPVILVNQAYWRGLIDWMRERLAGEGMIGANDLDLLQVFDQPQDVVDAIFAFYAKRGFAPSPAEREVLLNL